MRRPSIGATAAAAIAALAAVVAVPALTGAQGPVEQVVTVREKVPAVKFVHQRRTKRAETLAMGDRAITRQALYDQSNHRIGTLYTDCVNVGRKAAIFKATLECNATYRLPGGEVQAGGVVKIGAPGAQAPILGGSVAFSRVRGYVEAGQPVKGFDTVDVLHIQD